MRNRCTTSLLRSGKHPRLDLIDAKRLRHRARGGRVVAGQHHHAQAVLAQRLQSAARRGLDRIGDGDDAGGATCHRHKDGGGAILPGRLRGIVQIARRNASVHSSAVALPSAMALPSTIAGRALAGRRGKIADLARD